MHLVACPWCGPRNESEFVCGGPARNQRPDDPGALGDDAWVDYLTHRPNPKGPLRERWWHLRGCGLWFVIERDTLTHAIREDPGDGV